MNKSRIAAKKKGWATKNREHLLSRAKEYRETNWESLSVRKKEYYRRNKKALNEYRSKWAKKVYWARKRICLDLLGGECVHCGSKKSLEFDHIDPKTKLFTICARMTGKFDIVIDEVLKCQLLCRPCHIKKTTNEILTKR